jgi:hypothetical protein
MTLQRRDILIYHERKYHLNLDIFRSYFEENPDRKPQKIGFDSNLHRGYFSEFRIIDDQLIAVDIRVHFDFDKETGDLLSKSVIEDALPNLRVCSWFSGTLLLFSTPSETNDEDTYLKMEITKGKVEEVVTLSSEEYDDFGNHAYDYC